MRIVRSGKIHDGAAGPYHVRSAARTTVTKLQDDTLLSAFRLGSDRESPDGHEAVFATTDLGETWEQRWSGHGWGGWGDTPGEVKGFEVEEVAPGELVGTGLWVDASRPELPFVSPETQGLLPMRIFHTRSSDGGRSWGPRTRIDTSPHKAASPASAGPLRLPGPSGGELWAQPYEVWKEYDDPRPGPQAAYLRFSQDGGQTWPEWATVAEHPAHAVYYWDQRLAVHPETGRIVVMFWTHDPSIKQDIDVHIAWGSADGRTWTLPTGTGLTGQHCQPISLGGDRLGAVYTHRKDPPGIVFAVSEDFGRTWHSANEIVVYSSPVGTESGAKGPRESRELWDDMIAWRFGHPRGLLLNSREVFLVYYAGDDDIKSPCWARVEL